MAKSTPETREPVGQRDSPAISLRAVLELVGTIVAPTTIVSMLLFTFGWTRTNSLFGYFGINQSVLAFSTQDYLLRSIEVAFEPVRWALLVGLGAVWFHFMVTRLLEAYASGKSGRLPGILTRLILGLGLVLIVSGPFTALLDADRRTEVLFFAVTWTSGIALTGYGLYLTWQLRDIRREAAGSNVDARPVPTKLRQVSLWLMGGLFILGLFWTVSSFADSVGRYHAQRIAGDLDVLPGVTLFSQAPLGLEGPGVEETLINREDGAYKYRYSGLRFLMRSGGKYFLLPEQWSATSPTAFIVPDTEGIRIDVVPGSKTTP